MDVHKPEQRSRNMRAIKSKNTKMEVKLAKALWNKGHRFRRNSKYVFGKPDFSLKKFKLAIFVDGEFWHGKDWLNRKHDHKSNIEFWHKKIERNIERDKEVNLYLTNQGWKVLRFWGKEIEKNLNRCLNRIEKIINEAQANHLH